MQQLIITRGLPGSGKSTYAREWVNQDPKERIIVNRDSIRRMLGPYWVPEREGLVTTIEHNMIRDGLINNYHVILDATNFKATIKNYSDMIRAWGIHNYEVKFMDFTDVPLEVCLERDKLRPGDQQVGEEVIMNFYNKYLNNGKKTNIE